MEERIYKNSLNYIPIDVAKGIDRRTGKRVNADDRSQLRTNAQVHALREFHPQSRKNRIGNLSDG